MSVSPGSEYIDNNWSKLMRPYIRWVAVGKDGLIVDAGNYLELIFKLGERKDLSKITIAVIHPGILQA